MLNKDSNVTLHEVKPRRREVRSHHHKVLEQAVQPIPTLEGVEPRENVLDPKLNPNLFF